MTAAPDFFAQKTVDELCFFAENPGLYEPALVNAAVRELHRRGQAPGFAAAPAPPKMRPALLALPVVLALAGGWWWTSRRGEAAPAPATAALIVKKASPKLETVQTNALPDFGGATAASVTQQLARVPAAEKAALADQPRRQYQELSRRFWAAETLSEYLTGQVSQGKPNPMLTEQALLVREAWQQWNHAAVYSYQFGPAMTDHLDRMGRAASLQQHVLDELPDLAATHRLLGTPALRQRDAELQDLLSGLLPASPVSGQAYRKLTRQVHL